MRDRDFMEPGQATSDPPPLLCLGETMVLLTADDGPLEENSHVGMHVGGAESNVACGLSHLGHQVEWFSRVGEDPFGRITLNFLKGRGVHTASVTIDSARPTGVYFKSRDKGTSVVYYYRAGSAASAMSPLDIASLSLKSRSLCHLSGITAALSTTTDDLLQRLIVDRDIHGPLVSFDVNYRPGLWPPETAAPRLLELARAADIVLVGRDEAQVLWGTETAHEVRELIPEAAHLVVKDAGIGATHFDGDHSTFQPALVTKVVEPVGAGDAFAAGFLSGLIREYESARALRTGHLMAALTLQHVSDLPQLPSAESIFSASELVGDEWQNVRLTSASLGDLKPVLQRENTRAT